MKGKDIQLNIRTTRENIKESCFCPRTVAYVVNELVSGEEYTVNIQNESIENRKVNFVFNEKTDTLYIFKEDYTEDNEYWY